MDHTTQNRRFLKMIEPPTAVRCINQSSLMGTVDLRGALLQHHTALIRTIDVARTEHRLPTLTYTSLWDNQVIPAIALQELRALSHRPFVDRGTLIEQRLTISRHLMYDDRACPMTAAPQIGLSIFIPERTGVFPFLHTAHEMERRPRAVGILGSRHIEPLFGGAEVDVVKSVVITYGWCPRSSCIVLIAVPSRLIEA